MNTTEEKPPVFNETEVAILDLMRERTRLQRSVRPLLERIEQINVRLRALCEQVDPRIP